jgi:hypothetical protein
LLSFVLGAEPEFVSTKLSPVPGGPLPPLQLPGLLHKPLPPAPLHVHGSGEHANAGVGAIATENAAPTSAVPESSASLARAR